MIEQADVDASNGVVHVINGVLLPAVPKNIVEVAASVASLSTLVTAVKAASLVTTLSSTGPFTVFAPTSDAFAKIKNLNAIIQDKALLTKILLLHTVVGSVIGSGDLKNGHVVTTSSGDLTFNKANGKWTITAPGSTAMIEQADVATSNGVVHVIDGVLLPAMPK